MADERTFNARRLDAVRTHVADGREWLERRLVWRVWERISRSSSSTGASRSRARRSCRSSRSSSSSPPSSAENPLVDLPARSRTGSVSAGGVRAQPERPSRPRRTCARPRASSASCSQSLRELNTPAIQRSSCPAWRRPPRAKVGAYNADPAWLVVVLGEHGLPRRLARSARQRPGSRVVRGPVPRDDVRVVVVHRLVPPARRRAVARADPVGDRHERRAGDLRVVRDGVDAERRHPQRGAVRLLRRRARAGHLVLGRGDRHPHRRLPGAVFAEDRDQSGRSSAAAGRTSSKPAPARRSRRPRASSASATPSNRPTKVDSVPGDAFELRDCRGRARVAGDDRGHALRAGTRLVVAEQVRVGCGDQPRARPAHRQR